MFVLGYHNSLKLEVATNSPNLIKFITRMEEEASKIDLKAKLLSQKQALEQLSKGKKQKNIPCEKFYFSNILTDTTTWQSQLTEVWQNYQVKNITSKELLEQLGRLSRKFSK